MHLKLSYRNSIALQHGNPVTVYEDFLALQLAPKNSSALHFTYKDLLAL